LPALNPFDPPSVFKDKDGNESRLWVVKPKEQYLCSNEVIAANFLCSRPSLAQIDTYLFLVPKLRYVYAIIFLLCSALDHETIP
jgi:hypothetical protein